jgi:RNA polymerase sigma-70 factor (ECF subfamily)
MKRQSKTAYTSHDEDKRLVREAVAGNQDAYGILLTKYKGILFTAATRRLPDKSPEDLEDIVMTVLGTVFIRLNTYDPEKSKVFSWMLMCLHSYISSIPQQKKRVPTTSLEDVYGKNDADDFVEYQVPSDHNFDEDIDKKRAKTLIRLLLNKLPPDISKAIVMKYFHDSTHKEIAQAIGCEESIVWYKIKKGRELLKKLAKNQDLFN